MKNIEEKTLFKVKFIGENDKRFTDYFAADSMSDTFNMFYEKYIKGTIIISIKHFADSVYFRIDEDSID